MCGINGIIDPSRSMVTQETLKAMNDAIKHRGPDGEGFFIDSEVGLAHRRLSIIDVTEQGSQPMFSFDKRYVIVYNGEIYNFEQIRNQFLGEYSFQSETDTEVLLALYVMLGERCLDLLEGMFSFIIYDTKQKSLFAARDRMGVKPLYYAKVGQAIFFSSEIKGILASGKIERKINAEKLGQYLRHQTVFDPYTLVEGVMSLPAGHCIEFSSGVLNVKPYYDLKAFENESNKDYSSSIAHLMTRAVQKRMRADVPFGAFLSGGIDSSMVVGLMSQASKHPINTFSITFQDPLFDEGKYARIIANKYQTNHTEIELDPKELLEILPEAIQFMDHPSGDGLNTYLVSKLTRQKGIKMALSGLGGDELFAGYDLFKRMHVIHRYRWAFHIPLFIRKISAYLLSFLPSIKFEKYRELISLPSYSMVQVYDILRSTLTKKQVQTILKQAPQEFLTYTQASESIPFFSQVSLLEYNFYLRGTLLRDADMMSMANGLEVRLPFMDHTLIERVLAVRDVQKYPHTPKKLLTQSLPDIVPMSLINRKKMGFTFPWKTWLKTDLKTLAQDNLQDLARRPYFNQEAVTNLWESFLKDDPSVSWSRIWTLVSLELWMKEHQIN